MGRSWSWWLRERRKGQPGGKKGGRGLHAERERVHTPHLFFILRSFVTAFLVTYLPYVYTHVHTHTHVRARSHTHTHTHMTEEWERMMEDIKDYPDPNVKIATVDVG